jgi:hypothetical protein
MGKKLEHHMLLDAKQVEDLGLGDYLWDARSACTGDELEKILRNLIEGLASCDVSKDYVSVDRLARTV